MVREKKTKAAFLVISLIAIALSVADIFLPIPLQSVGIGSGSSFPNSFIYHFFHANIFHAILNVWCLLTIAFIYDAKAWQLILGYVIASLIPGYLCCTTVTAQPTIGLSGICFTLMGLIIPNVKRKLYYNICVFTFIAIGFFFPYVNASLHLRCYVVGLLVGFLNTPIYHEEA